MFKCPDDPTVGTTGKFINVPVSYAYNWNVGYMDQLNSRMTKASSEIDPAQTSDLPSPARTVLICEVQGVTSGIEDMSGREASSPAVLGNSMVALSNVDGSEKGMRYATGVLLSDLASAAVVGTDPDDAVASTGVHRDGSNFLLADGHVKWSRPSFVSAGLTNNIGPDDCTAGQALTPAGKAGPGYAAATACPDTAIVATFSVR